MHRHRLLSMITPLKGSKDTFAPEIIRKMRIIWLANVIDNSLCFAKYPSATRRIPFYFLFVKVTLRPKWVAERAASGIEIA